MIDPVDGVDPFGIVQEFVVHPPNKLNFSSPALHIETGLDPVSAKPALDFPACAPTNISNERFYNAWNGPIWQVNATDYGHMSIGNPGIVGDASGLICDEPPKSVDEAIYRESIAGIVALFLQALFLGEQQKLLKLEDKTTFPFEVILKHDYHGYKPATLKPYCTNGVGTTTTNTN
jgi:hypothetical protein